MSVRLLSGSVVLVGFVTFGHSAWAGTITYVENESLTGERSFCAVVSDFKALTQNTASFLLQVRFSRDVPYSVRVNGKLERAKRSGTLKETDFASSNGDNIPVTVTRNGQYRFDVHVTQPVNKFAIALTWSDEAASRFSIEPISCSK